MDQSVATELAKLKDLLEMGFIGSHIPTLLCLCIFQKKKNEAAQREIDCCRVLNTSPSFFKDRFWEG
jgi:hypothetical protein